ncbi:hypothetical protein [Nostoc sp.]|uniref:hypothetical protein n=1 Tax=Nostoc sp. TaxID=1180 RepID=UPI002FF9B682
MVINAAVLSIVNRLLNHIFIALRSLSQIGAVRASRWLSLASSSSFSKKDRSKSSRV